MIWATIAASEIVSPDSPMTLGLFAGGIAGTAALVWKAGKERQAVSERLARIEERITRTEELMRMLTGRMVEQEDQKKE